MGRKIALWFLILSLSLFQAFGSLSEEDTHASSDLNIRKKRIIDDSPNIDNAVLHQEVRYVVALLAGPHGCVQCTGIILGPHVVLTAAHCVYRTAVTVVSGVPRSQTQTLHTVVNVHLHNYDPKHLITNDIALLVLREPIDIIHSYNRAISIYNGTLPPNSEALISGWGYFERDRCEFPTRVRSILVPIINNDLCYQRNVAYLPTITVDKHICTLYPNREKCCWSGDSGAPLVYNGQLIGVFSTFHKSRNAVHQADIFMSLLNPDYKSWITSNNNFIHNNHLYRH